MRARGVAPGLRPRRRPAARRCPAQETALLLGLAAALVSSQDRCSKLRRDLIRPGSTAAKAVHRSAAAEQHGQALTKTFFLHTARPCFLLTGSALAPGVDE